MILSLSPRQARDLEPSPNAQFISPEQSDSISSPGYANWTSYVPEDTTIGRTN